MSQNLPRPLIGLLIVVPSLFLGLFSVLAATFNYPTVLQASPSAILQGLAAGGLGLTALWYGMALAALLLLPLSLGLGRAWGGGTLAGQVLQVAGVVAGLVQAVGFLRWVWLYPVLAQTFGQGDAPTQAAVLVVFQAAHAFLGAGVGEHLGYLFTVIWTLALVRLLLRQATLPAWLAWLGVAWAAGIGCGLLTALHQNWTTLINALAYSLWSVWLVGLGVWLGIRRAQRRTE